MGKEKRKRRKVTSTCKELYQQIHLNDSGLNGVILGFGCLTAFLMPNIYVTFSICSSLRFINICNHSLHKIQY